MLGSGVLGSGAGAQRIEVCAGALAFCARARVAPALAVDCAARALLLSFSPILRQS